MRVTNVVGMADSLSGEVKAMISPQKPSVIDVTQLNSRRLILPKTPLLTSYNAGWRSLGFEHHVQPAFETPEHYTKLYVLVVCLKYQSSLRRKLGDRNTTELAKPSDVAVIPPNTNHWVATDSESEFIVLTLDATLLNESIHESVNPDAIEILPHFSKPDPLIYQISLTLKAALELNGNGSNFYAESMAMALSAHLLQHYSSARHTIPDSTGGLPQHKLKQVIEYITSHLDEDLFISAIAKEVGMSQFHFARLFKQSTGVSPYQYVIQCRIDRAKKLLSQHKMKISEVSTAVGFADQSQFTRHFKRLVGVTPQSVLKN